MEREHLQDDLIDLGAATTETKGASMGLEDSDGTLWIHGGLSDD